MQVILMLDVDVIGFRVIRYIAKSTHLFVISNYIVYSI